MYRTMHPHRCRFLRREFVIIVVLVRCASSVWQMNLTNMCIPDQLNHLSCTAFLQTLQTAYESSYTPEHDAEGTLAIFLYLEAVCAPSHKTCAGPAEILQTVQTAYKPSYKPCTAPRDFLQTVQTVTMGSNFHHPIS